jgi:hypothetical protein
VGSISINHHYMGLQAKHHPSVFPIGLSTQPSKKTAATVQFNVAPSASRLELVPCSFQNNGGFPTELLAHF